MSAQELALPDPQTTAVAQIPRVVERAIAVREACAATGDLDRADELRRALDAFHRYIADPDARAAIAREQRLTEVLIGELLGPAENRGPATVVADNGSIDRRHRHDFRRLAANGDRVAELVDAGVVDRAPILRQLEADDPRAAELRERQQRERMVANIAGAIQVLARPTEHAADAVDELEHADHPHTWRADECRTAAAFLAALAARLDRKGRP